MVPGRPRSSCDRVRKKPIMNEKIKVDGDPWIKYDAGWSRSSVYSVFVQGTRQGVLRLTTYIRNQKRKGGVPLRHLVLKKINTTRSPSSRPALTNDQVWWWKQESPGVRKSLMVRTLMNVLGQGIRRGRFSVLQPVYEVEKARGPSSTLTPKGGRSRLDHPPRYQSMTYDQVWPPKQESSRVGPWERTVSILSPFCRCSGNSLERIPRSPKVFKRMTEVTPTKVRTDLMSSESRPETYRVFPLKPDT